MNIWIFIEGSYAAIKFINIQTIIYDLCTHAAI